MNHAIPNKEGQVIDKPASTFEGLRYKEINMVNSYNYYNITCEKIKCYSNIQILA